MKSLVIYDSVYGSTEMIAGVIAHTLGTEPKLAKDVAYRDLKDLDLIVVGSPTHGGRPTPAIGVFFELLSQNSLKGIPAAAFDTRFSKYTHGLFLRVVMNIFGFAAPRIQTTLKSKGATPIAEPEGFIVQDKEGGLAEGELENAKKWAEMMKQRLSTNPYGQSVGA